MSKETIDNQILYSSDGGSIYWKPGDTEEPQIKEIHRNVLLIPSEEEVFMPHLQVSSIIHQDYLKEIIRIAQSDNDVVFVFLPGEDFPDSAVLVDDLHVAGTCGVFARITHREVLPDGSWKVEFNVGPQGIITKLTSNNPILTAEVEEIEPLKVAPTSEEFAIEEKLEQVYESLKAYLSPQDRDQLNHLMADVPRRTVKRVNFMIQNSPLNVDQRYTLLLELSLSQRIIFLLTMLQEEIQVLTVRSEIGQKAAADMNQRQREEFLRSQLQQIRNELGESEEAELDELKERAAKKNWSKATEKRFHKELNKLSRFNPTTPDYAVQYTYLDTCLNLPWLHTDNSDFSLKKVEEILDRDHYGLEKVKERIIEQMAVMKLRKDTKSPIICLYGPPGVGKTSLGKSIAEALGRKYVRVALGGLHDEAELRGHRRTYLGSMPGRIIDALEQAGSSDPVMVLDEIDKIGQDYKGDPEQALLEVLDPEQNCKFHDNYIDQDYDLSKVLFIATANSIQKLSSPLLDRMELIEISGYVEAEKLIIARLHLIPRDLLELGFAENEISFSDEAILTIINDYTRESGVRKLEKKICEILRKIARQKVSEQEYPTIIEGNMVKDYLGNPLNFNDVYEGNDMVGVVTGLAWTQAGGEILFIESSIAPGKEGKLTLTGNLGDVMKESAMLALQYVKANFEKIGIKKEDLEFGNLHIHVPEGAVPKDGPSAGVTILTSLASSFSGRKVRPHLAMTGEITLRGKVLPVGGIKEKILAAKRAGIKTILLSSKNKNDIEDIKPEYIEGLDFKYVDYVDEVLDFALI